MTVFLVSFKVCIMDKNETIYEMKIYTIIWKWRVTLNLERIVIEILLVLHINLQRTTPF